MAVTLRKDAVAEVIRRVLAGRDHRDVVVDMIDAAFVSDALRFFEQVVYAKIRDTSISVDWYRTCFLDESLPKDEFATNGGLNVKTIQNKRRTTRKEIVIEEALDHYGKFVELIDSLSDDTINIDLRLTLGDVTVRLDLNETLVVVNALAVRRAATRGGAWSTLGKQVEGPLMEILCRLSRVDPKYFTRSLVEDDSIREIDFFLLTPSGSEKKCEVKLMGQGNPESADAIHARDTDVFVASTLSNTNKQQLDDAGVLWVELQVPDGLLRFQNVLDDLGIMYVGSDGFSDSEIEKAIRYTLAL